MTLSNLCRHTIQADEYQAELEAAEMRADEAFDNKLMSFEADCQADPAVAVELLIDVLNNTDHQQRLADALVAAMTTHTARPLIKTGPQIALAELLVDQAVEYINAED